ncbi:cell wall metabolism sensor histidine kinase WalK [Paenibacillus sp. FSL A5-0031]|uniref:sensor histidine kinase n=1 Tax=Paenibacillus sp. FSL A5-0031 TaxID=1920420 RepID=UPI001184B09A|nr:ATP-binding protein [Paenibacillus sp. FSL A5-0031]
MKDNIALKLVFRSLLNMVISAVLSAFSLYILLGFGMWLIDNVRPMRVLYQFVNSIVDGRQLLPIAGSVFLFFVFYIILQWSLFHYLGQMNKTVRGIADGTYDMDYQIEVRKRNIFGPMAANMNSLAGRLHHALVEERKAEQTKNELITNVSHDLRTPLTSVLGYLGLIEQDRYRDEVELRHYVQIAYEKSMRLNVLINDLFEYTRMRHDTTALKVTNFNLIEMLGQLLVQFRLPLEEAGMQSKLVTDKTSVMIKGDAAKLVRVFENLIVNAMNYGRDGKQVVVTVQLEGSAAVIEVINFGEPIPMMDIPHIFERFYRVDKSRTQWSGGSGLGLAIVKGIVEKHEGTISVTSDSEQTAFRITLPIIN